MFPTHASDRIATITGSPAGNDHFAFGVEAYHIAALWMQVAEERAFRAAEWEVGHRGRDANVDADVACLDTVTKLACCKSALCEDRGCITVFVSINQTDGLVQALNGRQSN